jgi:hypothetical protein
LLQLPLQNRQLPVVVRVMKRLAKPGLPPADVVTAVIVVIVVVVIAVIGVGKWQNCV